MKTTRFAIWEEGEYSYPRACGFVPELTSYIHEETNEARPCMLVIPGGAYAFVSPREGAIVARKFFDFGMNAFVLTYTVNPLSDVPLKDQPLRDAARAIRLIRARAEQYRIRPDRVAVCGFSAGGHLAASLCVHFADAEDGPYGQISARPDAGVLSYPVITSGEFAHRGSFVNLLGKDAPEAALYYMSLETQVTKETPPCFLWHTATDESVPVENSELFAAALRKNGVTYAMHIFSQGHHGLSLANEDWAEGRGCEPYTLAQTKRVIQALREGRFPMTEEAKMAMNFADTEEQGSRPKDHPVPEVTAWPGLAWDWLRKQGF